MARLSPPLYNHRPELFEALCYIYWLLWEHSTLDPVLKDLVRLKSAYLNGSHC